MMHIFCSFREEDQHQGLWKSFIMGTNSNEFNFDVFVLWDDESLTKLRTQCSSLVN